MRYLFGPYDEEDAAEDTDVDSSEVDDAWHWAREDSGRDETGYGADYFDSDEDNYDPHADDE